MPRAAGESIITHRSMRFTHVEVHIADPMIVDRRTRPRPRRRAARWHGSDDDPSPRACPSTRATRGCAPSRETDRARRRTRSSRRHGRRRAGSRSGAPRRPSMRATRPVDRASRDSAASPHAMVPSGSVISGGRSVAHPSRRRVEQLRHAPRGQTEAGVEIEERVPAVTVDATVVDGRDVELLALEGLDGKPPQLGDAHRTDVRPRTRFGAATACVVTELRRQKRGWLRLRRPGRPVRPPARARGRHARRRPGGRS